MLRHAKLTSTSESESSNLVTLSASITAYSSVLQVLIDSGATLNFINEWIVTQLKLKTEPCPSTRVTLADGRLLTHCKGDRVGYDRTGRDAYAMGIEIE